MLRVDCLDVLCQPAGRLFTWGVNRVALEYRSHRDAIVVIGGNMFGRASRIGEWYFQSGDLIIYPGLWYFRLPASISLLRITSAGEDYAAQQQQESKEMQLQVYAIHQSARRECG